MTMTCAASAAAIIAPASDRARNIAGTYTERYSAHKRARQLGLTKDQYSLDAEVREDGRYVITPTCPEAVAILVAAAGGAGAEIGLDAPYTPAPGALRSAAKVRVPNGVAMLETVVPAPKRALEDDGLDIPGFLRRENTPAARARIEEVVRQDRERTIRMPRDNRAVHNPHKGDEMGLKAPAGSDAAPKRRKRPTAARKGGAARCTVRAPEGKTKAAVVGDLLRRKNGCTTADILAATGWPTCSVPALAKANGLTLRKTKEGRITRYHGT